GRRRKESMSDQQKLGHEFSPYLHEIIRQRYGIEDIEKLIQWVQELPTERRYDRQWQRNFDRAQAVSDGVAHYHPQPRSRRRNLHYVPQANRFFLRVVRALQDVHCFQRRAVPEHRPVFLVVRSDQDFEPRVQTPIFRGLQRDLRSIQRIVDEVALDTHAVPPKSGVKFTVAVQICPKIELCSAQFMQQSMNFAKSSFSLPAVLGY